MQIGEVGKGIAQRRKQAGLSQEELAQRLGVTRQAISRWESGAALPTVDNLAELARVLDASVDELLLLSREEKAAGMSAESVGLLLDEQAERQEKRMKRLCWILVSAAALLALGIVLSIVLSARRTQQLESRMTEQIGQVTRQMADMSGSIGARVAGAVEEALQENRSLLADKGCRRVEYNAVAQTVDLHVFAYPLTLETQTAEFYAILDHGTQRISVPAQPVDGGFEAVVSIPAEEIDDYDYVSAAVYILWEQDGESVTEKICEESRALCEIRPTIQVSWGAHSGLSGSEFEALCTVAMPFEGRIAGGVQPVSLELSLLYNGEVKTSKTVEGGEEWNQVDSFTERIEWSSDEQVTDWENVLLHATLTDAEGNTYTKESSLH